MSGGDTQQPIDAKLLKVPYETLKRDARDRKGIIESVQRATAKVAKLSADQSVSSEQATAALKDLRAALVAQRDVNKRTSDAECASLRSCEARSRHLAAIASAASVSAIQSTEQRLPRLLVDYFLREGLFESAAALSARCDCGDLCEWSVFESAQTIVQDLRRHSCTAALAWCKENAPRLRRQKSTLVFALRTQEFVELIKKDETQKALAYARAHLVPFAEDHLPQFKRVLVLLVFRRHTKCARYRALLDDARWTDLAAAFLTELLKTCNLSPVPLLELQLQAGLTALKCPLSYKEACTKEDPLHLPEMKALAADLPWAKHVKSKLVCAISKSVMDDSNPPMVLPNGHVYSRAALQKMAAANDGQVKCPATGLECSLSACNQAYIM